MSSKPIAGRLRVSSEFTCSLCGGREAYCSHSQSAFERYILNVVMVRSVRCCDCDNLCYAFPVGLNGEGMGVNERVPLMTRTA